MERAAPCHQAALPYGQGQRMKLSTYWVRTKDYSLYFYLHPFKLNIHFSQQFMMLHAHGTWANPQSLFLIASARRSWLPVKLINEVLKSHRKCRQTAAYHWGSVNDRDCGLKWQMYNTSEVQGDWYPLQSLCSPCSWLPMDSSVSILKEKAAVTIPSFLRNISDARQIQHLFYKSGNHSNFRSM